MLESITKTVLLFMFIFNSGDQWRVNTQNVNGMAKGFKGDKVRSIQILNNNEGFDKIVVIKKQKKKYLCVF